MSGRSLDDFLAAQHRLLSLERKAEADEIRSEREEQPESERVRRGHCLRNLQVVDESSGPGGRLLVRLYTHGGLPAHRFQPGSLVDLFSGADASKSTQGVVYRAQRDQLVVALGEDDAPPAEKGLRLELGADDTTWRRIEEALRRLKSLDDPERERLREVLLGNRDAAFDDEGDRGMVLDERLDDSQREAVDRALRAQDVFLIHGPPGTGKTTTLVELVRRCVARGERLMVSAPSNIAVDNLVEKLVEHRIPVVRIGHPARLLPELLAHSLDAWIDRSDARDFAAQARKDLDEVLRKLRRRLDREEVRALKTEARALRQEIRRHERSAVDEVFTKCAVVAATCVGSADPLLREQRFDRVVVDEAAQALEATCWVPAMKGRRVVLGGDHRQLGPVLRSAVAQDPDLRQSLFERLAERHPDAVSMLEVQYRMHRDIMGFSSEQLYDGQLRAHDSVAEHLLAQLAKVEENEATRPALRFIDTAGCDLEESQESEGSSRWNDGELRLVGMQVRALVEAGLSTAQIAVITPYNAQVEALRTELYDLGDGLEIGSVDGFQGREKEAIVISMVRSNPRGEIGFLSEDRRNNVAFTRARRQLTVIGDSATLGRHPFLADFLAHCEACGAYESAWSYL